MTITSLLDFSGYTDTGLLSDEYLSLRDRGNSTNLPITQEVFNELLRII